MELQKVERPTFDLYDPNIKGNKFLYILIKSIVFFALFFYILYSITIIQALSNFSGLYLFLNVIVIIAELFLGYYSLLLLFHIANGFKTIDQELQSIITKADIKSGNVPFITILLPLYREPLKVVKQTIYAAMDLAYPKDKYELVIAEDGPKESSLEEFCNSIDIKYVKRMKRSGYKAGAVNNVLPTLKGKYVMFIDADHILEKNVLFNCLLAWRKDTIAVQARIDFVNTPSLLTTVSAYLQVQFFSLYQRARRPTGSVIFSGGSALFNRELLLKEGGLDPLTIADDTDTSFILRARGYRIEYIETIGAWALVPWDPLHLIRQIWRWLTGITRSFRARFFVIIGGKSNVYTKIDHISVSIFPTLSYFIWISAFLKILLIYSGNSTTPPDPLIPIPLIWTLPIIIPLFSIFAGVLAIIFDNKNIAFKNKPLKDQYLGISGFYILMFAGQPFLIGAILKGLFGIKVAFNRTPKEQKVKDEGLTRIKQQYFAFSVILAALGLISFILLLIRAEYDIGIFILMGLSLVMLIPLLLSIIWYWKLESYLETVEGVTAVNYI